MDLKLLEALKKGDRGAFDTVIRLYYPMLMGYTCIMVDEDTARDIVQEVFLYMWDKRDRLDFNPGFHRYLFKMCYSRAIDYLRRNKTLADGMFESRLMADELDWMKTNHRDIIKTLSERDLLKRVEELIEELPERRRDVFKLSFFHEMSNAEISELLDMPKRTVESHLYLGLKYLRGRIGKAELFGLLFILANIC